MTQVCCKFCNQVSSHTYSPSEYEGYFLTNKVIDDLGIRGHHQFDTVMDLIDFLMRETEYIYKCKHCGVVSDLSADLSSTNGDDKE
jgi:hypothetical protein